jgi:hypothetical protein
MLAAGRGLCGFLVPDLLAEDFMLGILRAKT